MVVPPLSVTDCALNVGPNISGCGGMFCIYFQTDGLTTDLINKCHCMNLTFCAKFSSLCVCCKGLGRGKGMG